MKPYFLPMVIVVWLASRMALQAIDPAEVNGRVSIGVNRDEPVWTITVTNHSKEKLSYENLGKVPRGLGLEVWNPDDPEDGWRMHAEDLAEFLNTDGFPADIREIAPGKSAQFQLNPDSMSAASDLALAKWRRAKRIGHYTCRVFFGTYASPMISIEPPEKAKHQDDEESKDKSVFREDEKEEMFGFKIRRMLNEKGLALLAFSGGSDRDGSYQISLTTCRKADLEAMASLDDEKSIPIPLPKLIARAKVMAEKELKDVRFEGMILNPCPDDESKLFASIYFVNGVDDTEISLLLNGAATETMKLSVTQDHYEQFQEYGVPKIRQQKKKTGPSPERENSERK